MASFGETLKRERESREISLREIAEATKINLRYLEAMEEDRFEALPGGIFTRGFIRAYAACLGIDGEALVRRYLEDQSVESSQPESEPRRTDSIDHQFIGNPGPGDPGHVAADPSRSSSPGSPAGPHRLKIPSVVQIGLSAIAVAGLVAGVLLVRREQVEPRETSAGDRFAAAPAVAHPQFEIPPDGRFTEAGLENPIGDAEGGVNAEPIVQEPNEAPPPPTARDRQPPAPARATAPPVSPRRDRVETSVAGIGSPPPDATAEAPRKPPVPAPPEPEAAPETAPEASPAVRRSEATRPPPGPMLLRIEVSRETWLWLACDSETTIDRRVKPGEAADLQCIRSIRLSAHDAGAIRLWVNGAPCIALGEDGARVYGYTIRFDDAHLICRNR